MSATTQTATWRIVAVPVAERDAFNSTGLGVCPDCHRHRYSANDPIRLVDLEGRELCPWSCAENRPGRFDLDEAWPVLRSHVGTGLAWQLDKLLRKQDEAEQAPARRAAAEAWRQEMKVKSEEAVRRWRELEALDPEERGRRARELSW